MTSCKLKDLITKRAFDLLDIIYHRSATALSTLNQKYNIQVNLKEANIMCLLKNYQVLTIPESIENITKENHICNDILSYNILNRWMGCLKNCKTNIILILPPTSIFFLSTFLSLNQHQVKSLKVPGGRNRHFLLSILGVCNCKNKRFVTSNSVLCLVKVCPSIPYIFSQPFDS